VTSKLWISFRLFLFYFHLKLWWDLFKPQAASRNGKHFLKIFPIILQLLYQSENLFFIFFSCIERQRVAFYQTFKTLQGFPLILHFWNRSRLYPMENFLKNFAFAACLPFRLKSESKIDENYCSLAFWITCSITGNGFWGKRVYFIHNSCNLV